jgi:hypothetical protein
LADGFLLQGERQDNQQESANEFDNIEGIEGEEMARYRLAGNQT